ncbi:type II secretion system protein GspG [Veronia nyctiphanis]|uniref:Type II secretion system core protein G n=1 Tax=Veronia nyctiphanis TaxID=1278244 RepID=A0A4Q0YNV5_9GAMM|nr:type II secretion system major pseudopilin GspG [Veronia nyctiphanis]RXJ72660.1 type II secretion system protein GspG [Veronia nyctiphanis]
MQRRQQGFTLLEIMIVIVILGVLASLVVPNLIGSKDQADKQKVISDISSFESNLDMYRLDNNVYPSTDQGLAALVSKPSGSPEPRNYKEDGYIKRLSKDPWGNDYQYLNPGEHGKIDIFSFGADGQEGGEGINQDIGNWNMHGDK